LFQLCHGTAWWYRSAYNSCCFRSCAGTSIKLQALLVNTGNTILKGVAMTVPGIAAADLTCKAGLTSDTDAAVLSTGSSLTLATEVTPIQKVVCTGVYSFLQADIDANEAAKVFTVSADNTVSATAEASVPATYTATASVTKGATAKVVLSINSAACVIPTIIPDGQTSESQQQVPLLAALQ
jgi:hypothetical protein